MEICFQCERPLQPWHPGPPFQCADLLGCPDHDFATFERRKQLALSHPLSSYLIRCRLLPFLHQPMGIQKIVDNPVFGIFDEMGVTKSAQSIIAAQILFERGVITRVVTVAPVNVREVWEDQEYGQLATHLWPDVHTRVITYHRKIRSWLWGTPREPRLEWVVTNYDYIRRPENNKKLLQFCHAKTLLIVDESSSVKSFKAKQTKAVVKLRERCGHVVLLNGTPIADNPLDMFAQGWVMDPAIMGCKSYFHARARYALVTTVGQKAYPKIMGWQNLEDLQRRFAPYVIRRLKSECLDLPPKMPPVAITARLTADTWKHYKQMRDDLCTWLSNDTFATASQAPVRVMRLAQITAGFIGGVEGIVGTPTEKFQIIGREKIDAILDWTSRAFATRKDLKLLFWTRLRIEQRRLLEELRNTFKVECGEIRGEQTADERTHALRLLHPQTAPSGPAIVVGITQAGSTGLNLAAAHNVIYASNDYSLFTRMQSEDRVHRPGQRRAVNYYDVVAIGPDGQRTIDHVILSALRAKRDVATWTAAAWIAALTDEGPLENTA